ncbi:MAG: AmmeMemoRadiSam system protein A [Chloroflexi bacterium]|nr:AmmeMemoRadiSam system protein A [Chloroflexota bacterium]
MTDLLSPDEKRLLLRLAREAITLSLHREAPPPLDLATLPPRLRESGASFVTLTLYRALRGCVGTIEARFPLAEDVRQHAIAAAYYDYRFPPLRPDELEGLVVEVSVLTPPAPLTYRTPEELLSALCPGVDGVVLSDGLRRATYLPQVWDKVPEGEIFLTMLCEKMGAPGDAWRSGKLQVQTYQVEKFIEGET